MKISTSALSRSPSPNSTNEPDGTANPHRSTEGKGTQGPSRSINDPQGGRPPFLRTGRTNWSSRTGLKLPEGKFSLGGLGAVTIEVARKHRQDEAFFEGKKALLQPGSNAFSDAVIKELEAKGTLSVPFRVFAADDGGKMLGLALRGLHRVARKVEQGTIEYNFGGEHEIDFSRGSQPYSWDSLKMQLPRYLRDLGKTVLDSGGENRSISWAENRGVTINVDLSGVSPRQGFLSRNFTHLMSGLGTSNLNKVTLNAEAFGEVQAYWQSVADMTCAVHPGSKLEELVLEMEQTHASTNEFPTVGPYELRISKMAEEALAGAIGNEKCKLKILRLPRLYLDNDGEFLKAKLQEREARGLSDIRIFGGYHGDVPLDRLDTRAQFPQHFEIRSAGSWACSRAIKEIQRGTSPDEAAKKHGVMDADGYINSEDFKELWMAAVEQAVDREPPEAESLDLLSGEGAISLGTPLVQAAEENGVMDAEGRINAKDLAALQKVEQEYLAKAAGS